MMMNAGMESWLGYLSSFVTQMGVGSGSTAPTVADTALATPVLTKALGGIRVSGTSATFETLFADTEANATLAEWGLFNAANGLVARNLFSASFTKTSGYEMIVSVTLALGNA